MDALSSSGNCYCRDMRFTQRNWRSKAKREWTSPLPADLAEFCSGGLRLPIDRSFAAWRSPPLRRDETPSYQLQSNQLTLS